MDGLDCLFFSFFCSFFFCFVFGHASIASWTKKKKTRRRRRRKCVRCSIYISFIFLHMISSPPPIPLTTKLLIYFLILWVYYYYMNRVVVYTAACRVPSMCETLQRLKAIYVVSNVSSLIPILFFLFWYSASVGRRAWRFVSCIRVHSLDIG